MFKFVQISLKIVAKMSRESWTGLEIFHSPFYSEAHFCPYSKFKRHYNSFYFHFHQQWGFFKCKNFNLLLATLFLFTKSLLTAKNIANKSVKKMSKCYKIQLKHLSFLFYPTYLVFLILSSVMVRTEKWQNVRHW